MAEQLEIDEAVEGEAHVLRVRGELDIATGRLLEARLRALRDAQREVVLDLSELTFIDSSGLAILVTTAKTAERDGGAFAIRAVSAAVMRVIELSGVVERLGLVAEHD